MELQTHCADIPVDNSMNNGIKPKPYRSELSLTLAYPNDSKSNFDEKINNGATPSTSSSDAQNPMFYHLPSPYPSATFPSSPLTPPTNFQLSDGDPLRGEKAPDFSHLKFSPLNTSMPIFNSNSSIFCTVSAPSTPALDRKCIDKFCSTESTNDNRSIDKKKSKRVSIVNIAKNESVDKSSIEQPINEDSASTVKESEKKCPTESNSTTNLQHSHMHKNHSHSHPKRRMSLDNTTVKT